MSVWERTLEISMKGELPMITLDTVFKNEASNINTASWGGDVVETTTTTPNTQYAYLIQSKDEHEHLKEQLAFAKEEIENLKRELACAVERCDSIRAHYEEIIQGYRQTAEEVKAKLKAETQRVEDMVSVVAIIAKLLADK